jgi:hypothetical protein
VTAAKWPTEYRIEILSPPYMSGARPTFSGAPDNLAYGTNFLLRFPMALVTRRQDISVVLISLGYHTRQSSVSFPTELHRVTADGVAVDQKLLELELLPPSIFLGYLTVKAPLDGTYMAPGPAWLYLVVKGVPSTGVKVMVGDGSNPPTDNEAYDNLMTVSARNGGKPIWYGKPGI